MCALQLANCKFDVYERAKLSKKSFQSGEDKREHSLTGCYVSCFSQHTIASQPSSSDIINSLSFTFAFT